VVQIYTGRVYYNGRKVPKGKKCYKLKSAANKRLRALMKKKKKASAFGRRKRSGASTLKRKRRRSTSDFGRRRRRSAFGSGGSYMPLSRFMSPYPRSVDSGPAWL
jgi:hypothetical protein